MPDIKSIFMCDLCGEVFPYVNDGSAEAEALEVWGVENASTNPEMATVCDRCWQIVRPDREEAARSR